MLMESADRFKRAWCDRHGHVHANPREVLECATAFLASDEGTA